MSYLIEEYDDKNFMNTLPATWLRAQNEMKRLGLKGFEFAQCISYDGVIYEVLYVDPNSDHTFWMEGDPMITNSWVYEVEDD